MSEAVEEVPVQAKSGPAYSEANLDFTKSPSHKAANVRSTYHGPPLPLKLGVDRQVGELRSQALTNKTSAPFFTVKFLVNLGLVTISSGALGFVLGLGLGETWCIIGDIIGGRSGRGKHQARIERRALEAEARGDLNQDFDDEEFLGFLESLGDLDLDLADFEE